MKKIILLVAVVGSMIFSSCEGPEGPRGETGYSAEATVYETDPINFLAPSFGVFFTFPNEAKTSDHVLVYRLSGVDQGEDVWQLIPQYRYFPNGTLDFGYNYDATRFDVNIYLEGNDLQSLNDNLRLEQIFRVVIIPGQFANKGTKSNIDLSDYNAIIKAYKIDESKIKRIN
ncbi:hypothetical protein [Flavobacterium sp.]|uniref:hypothetical protein n=1 Tax=Flavobacterium sp. TaxID=239 RepID=UPI00262E86BB|nr:hypothetical protein [Flavobacterium sp.]